MYIRFENIMGDQNQMRPVVWDLDTFGIFLATVYKKDNSSNMLLAFLFIEYFWQKRPTLEGEKLLIFDKVSSSATTSILLKTFYH